MSDPNGNGRGIRRARFKVEAMPGEVFEKGRKEASILIEQQSPRTGVLAVRIKGSTKIDRVTLQEVVNFVRMHAARANVAAGTRRRARRR